MKFQTRWLWAKGSIPIKNYKLYFLLFCLIISIFLVYYNWLFLNYSWKKCLRGRLNWSLMKVDFVVRIAFGYLFFVFFILTVLGMKFISIFCGVNSASESFPAFFFIRLLNIIFAFGTYLIYFIISSYFSLSISF